MVAQSLVHIERAPSGSQRPERHRSAAGVPSGAAQLAPTSPSVSAKQAFCQVNAPPEATPAASVGTSRQVSPTRQSASVAHARRQSGRRQSSESAPPSGSPPSGSGGSTKL